MCSDCRRITRQWPKAEKILLCFPNQPVNMWNSQKLSVQIKENDMLEQVKQSKSDSKKFWKLLDKLEKKIDDSVFKQDISNHSSKELLNFPISVLSGTIVKLDFSADN